MNPQLRTLTDTLARYSPADPAEAADVERTRQLVQASQDPWSRSIPLHVTASALIVHPESRRVLLRWHERQQGWLQVGGHGDPGETNPIEVALREGREETGLADLVPWPDAGLLHVVIVPVAAGRDEPAHRHADLRLVLATSSPETARPERPSAPLRWLSVEEAHDLVPEPNIQESLARVEKLFAG